jgi:hypothetical protein
VGTTNHAKVSAWLVKEAVSSCGWFREVSTVSAAAAAGVVGLERAAGGADVEDPDIG